MPKYTVSVNVGTYNPQWIKLKATLRSILQQKNISFQIVISDDGSQDDFFPEVRKFFAENQFNDYTLCKNVENAGVVTQIHHGLKAVDSEYVKVFSPGDLLYDENVLQHWVEHMRTHKSDISFCQAVYYNRIDGKLNIVRCRSNPSDLSIWSQPSSYHHKVYNYVVKGQNICGATVLYRTEILKRYMDLFVGKVKYFEDLAINLAILNQNVVTYYGPIGIWYEHGDGGISTSNSSFWQEKLKQDFRATWDICREYYIGSDKSAMRWLAYRKRFDEVYPIKWKKRLLRIMQYFKNPSWFYYRFLYNRSVTYTPTQVDDSFFNSCFGINDIHREMR